MTVKQVISLHIQYGGDTDELSNPDEYIKCH